MIGGINMRPYTIMGRQVKGTKVIGYILYKVDTNETICLPRDDVYKLAMNKQVNDVTAQEYNGAITIKGTKHKLNSLPKYDINGKLLSNNNTEDQINVSIIYKIVNGKNIIGYGIEVKSGDNIIKSTTLSKEDVIVMAKQGIISNVRYQRNNGKDILRGVGCNMSDIPSIAHYGCSI